MKKLISFLLCLMLTVSVVPSPARASALNTETMTEIVSEIETAEESTEELIEESSAEESEDLPVAESSAPAEESEIPAASHIGPGSNVITGFAEFDLVEHSLNFAPGAKPSKKDLLAMMPKTLSVCLDESMVPVDLPVSWRCLGQDYENSDAKFYQFVPVWKEPYVLADYIDLEKDAPYVGVFFYGVDDDPYTLDASCLSSTDSLYISRLKNSNFVFSGKSYAAKKDAMISIAQRLLEDGFEPAFAAGVMANVACEGTFGKFENICGYTVERLLQVFPKLASEETRTENYVAHINGFADYDTCGHDHSEYQKYSKNLVYDGFSLSELSDVLARYSNEGWKAKFGLGSIQWTGRRTANLVNNFYLTVVGSADKITAAQCSEAEMQMMVYELKGTYNSVYVNWKNANADRNTADAADNAGYRVCYYYEIPSSRESSSVTRGALAREIYTVMSTCNHTPAVKPAVNATCTAAGKTEGKYCTICGAVLTEQTTIPAKGHSVVTDNAVSATCTAAGKTAGSHCSVCKAVIKAQDTIPAKGHISDNGTTNGSVTTYKCVTCGAVLKTVNNAQPLTLSNVSGGVKVTWNKCPDAYKYAVYYRVGDSGSWKKASTTKSTYYTKKSLKSGTTYFFQVKCLNKKGKVIAGHESSPTSIKYLAAPTCKSASVAPEGITVTWKPVTGASRYCVLRKMPDGSYQRVTETTGTSATAGSLANGTTYTFTVACVDGAGKIVSAYSTKGMSATYVSPGQLIDVVNDTEKAMTVRWQQNPSAGGYQIQYSTYSNFARNNKAVTITGGETTSRKVSKLSRGKTYYVRIRSWIKIGKKKYYSAWTTIPSAHVTIVK